MTVTVASAHKVAVMEVSANGCLWRTYISAKDPSLQGQVIKQTSKTTPDSGRTPPFSVGSEFASNSLVTPLLLV